MVSLEKILRCFERVNATTTLDDLASLVSACFEEFGFDWYALIQVRRPGGLFFPQFLLGDNQHPWAVHYRKQKYFSEDPAVRYMFQSMDWYTWSQVQREERLSQRGKKIFEEARRYGLLDGLIMPIHRQQGEVAFFTVTGSNIPTDDHSLMGTLAVLLAQIHHQFSFLRNQDDNEGEISHLTHRERDALGMRAQGMGLEQIAKELDLSTRAVKERLLTARQRLGVETTEEAIALAISTGQIFPPVTGNWTPVQVRTPTTRH